MGRMIRWTWVCGLGAFLGGCGQISVAPSCPETLAVGEAAFVAANPTNPGAVPTYQWEVLPPTAGTFADTVAANTTFRADAPGIVTLRITASDSIFLAVGECRIEVPDASGLAVALEVDVPQPTVGSTVTLTCSNVGEAPIVGTSLSQTDGPVVELLPIGAGQATFTPTETGDLTFRCVGTSASGATSPPSDVGVTVVAATGGGRTPRR